MLKPCTSICSFRLSALTRSRDFPLVWQRTIAKQDGGPALGHRFFFFSQLYKKSFFRIHLPRFPPVSLFNWVSVEKCNHLALFKHLDHLLHVELLQLVDVLLPLHLLLPPSGHLTRVRHLLEGLRWGKSRSCNSQQLLTKPVRPSRLLDIHPLESYLAGRGQGGGGGGGCQERPGHPHREGRVRCGGEGQAGLQGHAAHVPSQNRGAVRSGGGAQHAADKVRGKTTTEAASSCPNLKWPSRYFQEGGFLKAQWDVLPKNIYWNSQCHHSSLKVFLFTFLLFVLFSDSCCGISKHLIATWSENLPHVDVKNIHLTSTPLCSSSRSWRWRRPARFVPTISQRPPTWHREIVTDLF